jgi:E3 ubiquitin-protein ligase HERC2
MFWRVLQSFNQQERRLFLRFVWGRETLPASHEWKKGDQMTISRFHCNDNTNNNDDPLPQASTCFFSLKLPPYSKEEVMRNKLLLAITNCSTIDSDFNTLPE